MKWTKQVKLTSDLIRRTRWLWCVVALWLASCQCNETRWSGNSCKQEDFDALRKEPFFEEGALGGGIRGCLQITWAAGEKGVGILVRLTEGGELLAFDPDTGAADASPLQTQLPPGTQGPFGFRFLGFGAPPLNPQPGQPSLQALCETKMSQVGYTCGRSASDECWFSLRFQPTSDGRFQAKEVPGRCQWELPTPPPPRPEPIGPDAASFEPPKPEAREPPKPEGREQPTEPRPREPEPREPPPPGASWAVHLGDVGTSRVSDIALDPQGNLLVVGSFTQSLYIKGRQNPLLTARGSSEDVFVLKLSPAGELLWAKGGGAASSPDQADAVAVDSKGNVYITGGYRGKAYFDSFELQSQGVTDIFVAQLSPDGQWLWAVKAGGAGSDRGKDLQIFKDKLVVVGYFTDKARFGTHQLGHSGGSTSMFLTRLDLKGTFEDARQVRAKASGTSSGRVFVNGLAVAGDGLYLTGAFVGEAAFDDLNLLSKVENPFVARFDAGRGKWDWARSLSSTGKAAGQSIAVDAKGQAYLTGVYTGDLQLLQGSRSSTAQSPDLFVSSLDAGGRLLWIKGAGQGGIEQGLGIALNPATQQLFVAGSFSGTFSCGNKTLTSRGDQDVLLVELNASTGAWTHCLQGGSKKADIGTAVALTPTGAPILTGSFSDSVLFEQPEFTARTDPDIFVWKPSYP